MEVLNIKDLSVTFSTTNGIIKAVKNASLTINKGEILALVGESGSGKTVTGLSISRLLPNNAMPPKGSIIFDGMELLEQPESIIRGIRGDRISMVFQEPMTSLNPLHTIERQVGEIIALHRPLGKKEIRQRIIELLHMVGLSEAETRLEAYPYSLSGGQRQRVMIAMALANDPDILIADEPTTALDVTIQAQILKLLKDIQARTHMAILFITHDLGIVEKIADRIAVMTCGEIVETDITKNIFTRPKHLYTRLLLKAEPKGTPIDANQNAPIIMEFKNVSVNFPIQKGILKRTIDCVRAVENVSAVIRQGQTIGIVGESGSGKSTLGMALLRLGKCEGEIIFMGHEIHKLKSKAIRPFRNDMQIVFQDSYSALNPRMTVGEIIGEGLLVHQPKNRKKENERLIVDTLLAVGLEEKMKDRFPHELSGGERQRVSIARALVLRPNLIILDEPTSSFDRSVQVQIIDLLRDIQQKHQIAYMFISHDLKVVKALSHYTLVMCRGKVVEQGPTKRIFEEPQERYTKNLMHAALNVKDIPKVFNINQVAKGNPEHLHKKMEPVSEFQDVQYRSISA